MSARKLLEVGLLVLGFGLFSAGGEVPTAVAPSLNRVTAISQSGQFSVVGVGSKLAPVTSKIVPVGEQALVALRPDLVAVTCERVRRAVNRELGFSDGAGLKVHLSLRPVRANEEAITIVPRLFLDGWQMYAEIPDTIAWERLIRLLVEADMLDHVNRSNSREPFVEAPLWLTEGLTGLLVADHGRDLVAESQTLLNRNARRLDSLTLARQALGGQDPLDLSELSEPSVARLAGADGYRHYRGSAMLLLAQLQREEKGRQATRQFIERLSHHLNWQMAFLEASDGQFRSMLDVEKWWAVAAVDGVGHDSAQLWPRARVLSEMEVILTETAEIPQADSPRTTRQTLALREVIATWNFDVQRPVLQRKVGQLRLLELHAPPDISPLLLEAVRILEVYLATRERSGTDPEGRMELETRTGVLVRATVRRLTALDAQVASARRVGRS